MYFVSLQLQASICVIGFSGINRAKVINDCEEEGKWYSVGFFPVVERNPQEEDDVPVVVWHKLWKSQTDGV